MNDEDRALSYEWVLEQQELYADNAPVAQGREQRSSKPTDTGSSPVGGTVQPTRCPGTPHRLHTDPARPCPMDGNLSVTERVQAAMEAFSGLDRRMTDRNVREDDV